MEEPGVGTRVLLSTKGGLTFAGSYRGVLTSGEGFRYRIVETDRDSGFCIMCPEGFVEELLVLPLEEAPVRTTGRGFHGAR